MKPRTLTVSLLDCVQSLKSELANLLYWSQSMSASRINRGRDREREREADRLEEVLQ